MRFIDLTGQRFGKIVVLSRTSDTKITKWLCKCDCGVIKTFYSYHLRHNKSKSCGCSNHDRVRSNHKNWTGYEEISGEYWNRIQRDINKRKKIKIFNISIEYAWDLFIKQNRKCAISGVPINMNFRQNRPGRTFKKEHTASLDRIDSSKGYIEGNVQWVHKKINIMKHVLSDEEFINWCYIIVANNPRNCGNLKCH